MSEMPFAGLKVLDLAWVVAGPAIGRVLADYGATVVRVESSTRVEIARSVGPFPGGEFDPQRSALYDNCNSGKLGVAVDLSRDEARQIIRDLTSWADVVIESFEGHALFTGKGKVVAKQEHRLGIRLVDVDKAVLARLQSEVTRLSPFGR